MTITMHVKAKNHAIVYDIDGYRIPDDQFVEVPLSAGTVMAVKNGDLEEVEEMDLPHRVLADIKRAEAGKAQAKPAHHTAQHQPRRRDSAQRVPE
jgi:hypothetical protein